MVKQKPKPKSKLQHSCLVVGLTLLGFAAACDIDLLHSPDDLLDDVNARVLVVGIRADELALIDVAGQSKRSKPTDEDIAEFQLVLPVGEHEGAVAILSADKDDDGDGPKRCGTFTITVVENEVHAAAIVADDLPRCHNDDDGDGEEGEGEGEVSEGEGEDHGGEGEVSEGEGDGVEGEGDGGGGGEGEGEAEDGEGEDEVGEGEGDI